jgi:hypothetical protein
MSRDDLIPVPADLLRSIRCDLLLAAAELRDYVTAGARMSDYVTAGARMSDYPTAATTDSIIELLDRDREALLSYAPYSTEVAR